MSGLNKLLICLWLLNTDLEIRESLPAGMIRIPFTESEWSTTFFNAIFSLFIRYLFVWLFSFKKFKVYINNENKENATASTIMIEAYGTLNMINITAK